MTMNHTAIERDGNVENCLNQKESVINTFKDQVIFEKDEVMQGRMGSHILVFTPYKNKWLNTFAPEMTESIGSGQ